MGLALFSEKLMTTNTNAPPMQKQEPKSNRIIFTH